MAIRMQNMDFIKNVCFHDQPKYAKNSILK